MRRLMRYVIRLVLTVPTIKSWHNKITEKTLKIINQPESERLKYCGFFERITFQLCCLMKRLFMKNYKVLVIDGPVVLPDESYAEFSKIIIEDGKKEIGKDAFRGCQRLKSIEIPNGIEKIGDSAFQGCINLTDVHIPDSVMEIGEGAFGGCCCLDVDIPASVTKIKASAFCRCNLHEIYIPSGVTEIEAWVFAGCAVLSYIDIPDGVTKIGYGAFYGCWCLDHITIPESVTEICREAFADCQDLEQIRIPKSTKMGWLVFGDSEIGDDVDPEIILY